MKKNFFLATSLCSQLIFLSFSGACQLDHSPADKPVNSEFIKTTRYEWQQVLPFGNGSFQEEWKPGTFPLGITPVVASGGQLWMTGQKMSWSSPDGIKWTVHKKQDWGERIYQSYIYFNKKLWMYGGMKYKERQLLNQSWFSENGITWRQAANASWLPRKGFAIIAFKNKLWLFGGAVDISADFKSTRFMNDIWSSRDGIQWTLESKTADWSPREISNLLIFRDTLYLFGGNGMGDIWSSPDGLHWKQVTPEAAWQQRYDYGALVFDRKIWIFGGRDTSDNHTKAARNDVWFSPDGLNWIPQTTSALWTVRSGANSVVFRNKIWLFSGKHTGGPHNWGGDVWTMSPVSFTRE